MIKFLYTINNISHARLKCYEWQSCWKNQEVSSTQTATWPLLRKVPRTDWFRLQIPWKSKENKLLENIYIQCVDIKWTQLNAARIIYLLNAEVSLTFLRCDGWWCGGATDGDKGGVFSGGRTHCDCDCDSCFSTVCDDNGGECFTFSSSLNGSG